MNFVDGIVKKEEEIYVDTKYGKVTLTKEKQDKLIDYVDKKVIIGVRPEHIKITDSGIKGKLNVYEMFGSEAICYMQVDDELQLTVKIDSATKMEVGKVYHLTFDENMVHVFDAETENTITN